MQFDGIINGINLWLKIESPNITRSGNSVRDKLVGYCSLHEYNAVYVDRPSMKA